MILNEYGVEIYNNKSRIIDNTIQKSFKEGVKVIGNKGVVLCFAYLSLLMAKSNIF